MHYDHIVAPDMSIRIKIFFKKEILTPQQLTYQ